MNSVKGASKNSSGVRNSNATRSLNTTAQLQQQSSGPAHSTRAKQYTNYAAMNDANTEEQMRQAQRKNSQISQNDQFSRQNQKTAHQRGNSMNVGRGQPAGRNMQHMIMSTNNAVVQSTSNNNQYPQKRSNQPSGVKTAQKASKPLNSSSKGLVRGGGPQDSASNKASGTNVRSMSMNKRLAALGNQPIHSGNNTIDMSGLALAQYALPASDFNNTVNLNRQFATIDPMAALLPDQGQRTSKHQQGAPTSKRGGINSKSQPKTTANKRSKHQKAFSMGQSGPSTVVGSGQRSNMPNQNFNGISPGQLLQIAQQRPPPVTEQYLNQPLKSSNQARYSTNQAIQIQNGAEYQRLHNIDEMNAGGKTFNFAQLLSPKDLSQVQSTTNQQMNNHGQISWPSNNAIMSPGQAAGGGPILVGGQQPQYSSYSFLQQQSMVPFTGAAVSNNQMSSTGSGLNQTGRSFSHCSGRQFQTASSGQVVNTRQQNQLSSAPNIPESQQIDSEEHFESAKVFLAEQKYKEAIKMFTKSIEANKMNFDALFYRAVANLDFGQPAKAIADLSMLCEECPDYRKTMFIVLSIAYRRVNDFTGALRTLSKALMKYPKYLEAYIARGQIYIFQKKWEKALSDFRAVNQLKPQNGLGLLGQGDSLKGIGNFNGALNSFTKAIEIDPKTMSQGLMKRGLLHLQMKQSELALDDFSQLTKIAEETNQQSTALSKAYFYKAKALKKLNNLSDAILYFEQVIRANDDNHLASSALYEIAKIKIQQKDFYEAYYNLKRASHFKLKQKKLVNYKMFTEGIIFLMKRKTKTGLKLITQLIERLKPSEIENSPQGNQVAQSPPDYIYNLVYLYRAYGYFVSEDYNASLKDYIMANKIKKLNLSSVYNMSLCQGLKSLSNKEYENAISFFTKASQKIQKNRDPYLLRAIAIVRYAMHKPIKPKTRTKMLKDAKRDLNKALKNSPKDYQVLYLRGIVNFALHFFYDAITDLETVIERSDEASANHYLARGRCYACLSMFKESITDLSIAINLNKDLLDAYLNRGKCAYLIGDTGLAFIDFQKLIVIEPKNPMVHIYAGNLLMTTGSYEDATKAFTNADNIQKSSLALYQRGRCNVALNQMNEALKDLNKVLEAAPADKVATFDRECLSALKSASGGTTHAKAPQEVVDDQNNPQNQFVVTGPISPLESQVYAKSAVALTKLINYESNEHLSKITHESSIQHQHSQMIPSAQRTKTDKIRAIRRRKEQDRMVKEGKMKRNDLRFRVQQQEGEQDEEVDEFEDISELDPDEIIKLNRQLELGSEASQGADKSDDDADQKDAEEANYYKENIFNKEDYFLYRAVMHIYAGAFEKALSDLEQSSGIMHANKVLQPKNQFGDDEPFDGPDNDNQSQGSSQTDLSDVGLCSLNIHEFSYNAIICHICMQDFEKALEKLDWMFQTIPKKYASQLWLIRAYVLLALGDQPRARKDLKRAEKGDKENYRLFVGQKKSVYLTIFPQQQRLCNFFAFKKLPLRNGAANIHVRPSFSFPFIKPPNMIPCVDNHVLDCLKPGSVPLKPEAPWIKRCSFGIKFTDEIYITDDERENTPDEEKEYKQRKARQAQQPINIGEDGNVIEMPRSFSEKVILRRNVFAETEQTDNNQTNTKEENDETPDQHLLVQLQNMNQQRGKGKQNNAHETIAVQNSDDSEGHMRKIQRAKNQQNRQRQKERESDDGEDNFDGDEEGVGLSEGSNGEYYEEDDFEEQYREQRKQYDKMEDIELLKNQIRQVTQKKKGGLTVSQAAEQALKASPEGKGARKVPIIGTEDEEGIPDETYSHLEPSEIDENCQPDIDQF